MIEGGCVFVTVLLVMVIINMMGTLGIPRPVKRQEEEINNQKVHLSDENKIDDVIKGIKDLMKNEQISNKSLQTWSKSTNSEHREETLNKVISLGQLSINALKTENQNVLENIVNTTHVSDITGDNLNNDKTEGKHNNSDDIIKKNVLSFDILTTTSSSIPSKPSTTTTITASKTLIPSTFTTVTSSSTTITLPKTSQETASTTVTSDDDHEVHELCNAIPDNSMLRNGLGSTGFTWPGGKIPYVIGDGFNNTQRETIQSAIDYYNREFKGCLEWELRGSQSNFVNFENTGTCSSRIGVAFYPFPISQSIYLGRCAHLEGHIKHEMMHTIGFYHEHSRSDRDMFIEIQWNNIPSSYHAQFSTYRWTTGYGEKYDYESIMHYSSRAFVKDYNDKKMRSITPKDDTVDVDSLGFKPNLSSSDIAKIQKMYKCAPFQDYAASCSSDANCGLNEYCALWVGECRTKLPAGSLCVVNRECLQHCGGGLCSVCTEDNHCSAAKYCAYKYLPGIEKECAGFCGGLCLLSSQCGGECHTCGWSFTCQQ